MIGTYARTIAGAAALALCFAVAGCGEKSEPATTGEVITQSTTSTVPNTGELEAAQAAANAFLVSKDAAAVCDDGITPALLKKAYGDRKGCIAARKPAALAEDVAIRSSTLNGPKRATIVANAKGGSYGKGEKVTMAVVSDDTGAWRVDTVKSNAPVGP